jgi:hypothetical protein
MLKLCTAREDWLYYCNCRRTYPRTCLRRDRLRSSLARGGMSASRRFVAEILMSKARWN